MSVSRLLLLPLLLLVTACSSVRVTTDYEPERDYSRLQTYAWMDPIRKIIIDPRVDNDLMSARIRRSVESRLMAQGFIAAGEGEGADFFITYNINTEGRIRVDTHFNTFGYHSCRGCWNSSAWGSGRDVTVRQYTVGALMIDVVDPASQRLIWRGVGEKRMPRFETPQERDLYIAEMVQAILERFPPNRLASQ